MHESLNLGRRFVAALANGDRTSLEALIADDARLWHPAVQYLDKPTYLGFVDVVAAQFPSGLTLEIVGETSQPDRAAIEVRSHGITASGVDYRNAYCLVFEVSGGRISHFLEYADTAVARGVLSVE